MNIMKDLFLQIIASFDKKIATSAGTAGGEEVNSSTIKSSTKSIIS